ncbi:hypothetical protein RHGRI_011675 [Rhododendron griersonianum]|uniref:Pentatricopeptide repeat-containing protein n=1 Tax=Rhododendron griersonianum TaxID=479676 RepID=A0AAV6KNZ8_9ERIC|nr:hypothetical protein RHGRI_011675 [Rhododendron griersonianum]
MAFSSCLLQSHPFTLPRTLNLPPLSLSSKSLKPICSIPHRELLTSISASISSPSPSPPHKLPPDFTTKQLLDAISQQNDETSVLNLFYWASEHLNFKPSFYEEIIRKLGHVGSLDSMKQILEDMRVSNCRPTEGTFQIFIENYAKRGLYDEAIGVLDTMEQAFGLKPGPYTYNFLLNVLVDGEKFKLVKSVESMMFNKGVEPGVPTFNILIKALWLCLTKNHDLAIDLLHGMKNQGCRPNEHIFNILINGLCSSGKLDRALGLLKDMESSGCTRGVVTYNTLISGFIKNKRIEEAKESFDRMILERLQPNNITYNSMLYHYCRVGDIKKTADIVQTMTSNGCEPDVVTYRALIQGLCNVDRIEIAIRLLITIQMKGMALAPQTYNPLLRELFKRKKTKAAMRLFREMKEKGDPPDAFSYETVFRGLCSGGGPIGEAVDFVVEMTEKRLIPKFSTFCVLAERLCALSMEDTLVMLVERIMVTYSFSENEASMIKGFMKIHKFEDALATLGGIFNRRNPKRGY